jgi:hypothetical protein
MCHRQHRELTHHPIAPSAALPHKLDGLPHEVSGPAPSWLDGPEQATSLTSYLT